MSKIKIIESDYALNEDTLHDYENKGLTLISVNHVLTHEYPAWTKPEGDKQEVVRWTYHFRVHEVDPTHGTAVGPICPTCKSDDATVPGTIHTKSHEAILKKYEDSYIEAVDSWAERHGVPCSDPYHTGDKKDVFDQYEILEAHCEECKHAGHAPGACQVLHVYARGPTDMPGNQRCLCGYVSEGFEAFTIDYKRLKARLKREGK